MEMPFAHEKKSGKMVNSVDLHEEGIILPEKIRNRNLISRMIELAHWPDEQKRSQHVDAPNLILHFSKSADAPRSKAPQNIWISFFGASPYHPLLTRYR